MPGPIPPGEVLEDRSWIARTVDPSRPRGNHRGGREGRSLGEREGFSSGARPTRCISTAMDEERPDTFSFRVGTAAASSLIAGGLVGALTATWQVRDFACERVEARAVLADPG